jgi:Ni2+-binding GTPase involved in maturation of urease and hydrogenase
MSERPCVVVVGGFLGAGKTTLILAAARELERRGMKCAVILNDQGDSLVDTQLTRVGGFDADEVTGGCFCCNFSDFLTAADALRAHAPDVIFAEPVGSCTDISATVLYPLREMHGRAYRLAPFTVCVDPGRNVDSNPHMRFLYDNQLAEADLVVYTKSDLFGAAGQMRKPERLIPQRYVSAQTGQGIAAWLDEVLMGQIAPGARTLNIDYEEYAQAEAALAWLNLSATVECDPPVSQPVLLGPMLDHIAANLEIVHLKATDHSDAGFLKAAQCGSSEDPRVEGALDGSPARHHDLLVNLRAVGEPAPVRAIVEAALANVPGRVLRSEMACFTPGAPRRPAWDWRS